MIVPQFHITVKDKRIEDSKGVQEFLQYITKEVRLELEKKKNCRGCGIEFKHMADIHAHEIFKDRIEFLCGRCLYTRRKRKR